MTGVVYVTGLALLALVGSVGLSVCDSRDITRVNMGQTALLLSFVGGFLLCF